MPSELPSADDPDPLGSTSGRRAPRGRERAGALDRRRPSARDAHRAAAPEHEPPSGLASISGTAVRPVAEADAAPMPAWLPFLLVMPSGLCNALSLVALPYFLAQRGLQMQQVGLSVALSMLPHAWRFLLGPLADLWLRRRSWYLLSVATSAMSAIALYSLLERQHPSLALINLFLPVLNLGVAMADTAVASLSASLVATRQQGRAASAYTLGQLGWQGILGSLILFLREPPAWLGPRLGWLPLSFTAIGIVAAGCMVAAGLTVLFVREAPPGLRQLVLSKDSSAGGAHAAYQPLWRELLGFVRSRAGMLGLLACVLPLGTSAIDCLEGALAGDYRAGAWHVAFVGGVGGTLAGLVGALAGGVLVARMGRFSAYCVASASMGITAIGLSALPANPSMYVVGMLFYGALASAVAAAFNAYAFQLIASSRAASSVCGLLYGAVNLPLSYMLVVDGWAHTQAGRVGLFFTDGIICLISVLALVAMSRLRLRSVEPQLSIVTK